MAPPSYVSESCRGAAEKEGEKQIEEEAKETQLQVFGKLDRNRLVKGLNLARKISYKSYQRKRVSSPSNNNKFQNNNNNNNNKKFKDCVVLQKLEELVREANRDLANNLVVVQESSKIDSPKERDSSGRLRNNDLYAEYYEKRAYQRGLIFNDSNNFKNDLEKKISSFNSNKRIQAIIEYSLEFFAKLLAESPIFNRLIDGNDYGDFDDKGRDNEEADAGETGRASKLKFIASRGDHEQGGTGTGTQSKGGTFLLEPQELKLYACVECQQLRSAIRFKWLTDCLMLAFSSTFPPPPPPPPPHPNSTPTPTSSPSSATPMSLELKRLLLGLSSSSRNLESKGSASCVVRNKNAKTRASNATSHLQRQQEQQRRSNDGIIRNKGEDRKPLEQQIKDGIRGDGRSCAGIVAGGILAAATTTPLAIEPPSCAPGKGGGRRRKPSLNSLIRAPEEEREEEVLLYKLAQLMSILLRQHFLLPALERLCNLFEEHQFIPTSKEVYVKVKKEEVKEGARIMSDGVAAGCKQTATTKRANASFSELRRHIETTSTPPTATTTAKGGTKKEGFLARGNELEEQEGESSRGKRKYSSIFPANYSLNNNNNNNNNNNHYDNDDDASNGMERENPFPSPFPGPTSTPTPTLIQARNQLGQSEGSAKEEASRWEEPREKTPMTTGKNSFGILLNPKKKSSRIEMKVELCASADDGNKITTSKPDEDLKRIFAFIIDELASLCKSLPRLETQLDSMSKVGPLEADGASTVASLTTTDVNNKDEHDQPLNNNDHALGRKRKSNVCIEVGVEEILAASKRRINSLIDRSFPLLNLFTSNIKSNQDNKENMMNFALNNDGQHNNNNNNWISPDYLLAVDLMRKLRNGQPVDPDAYSSVLNSTTNSSDNNGKGKAQQTKGPNSNQNRYFFDFNDDDVKGEHKQQQRDEDDRLRELSWSCKQIDLLNLFEMKLENGSMKRYHDFGFVLLDYKPLRDSLIKSFKKERLLMIRIELDSILKLMERLRLQFDEIELGIDLESAIEDYLANKWQAKQQQPAGSIQAVILSGADDDLVDDLDIMNTAQSNHLQLQLSTTSMEDNLFIEESARGGLSNKLALEGNEDSVEQDDNSQNQEIKELGQLKTNDISPDEEEFVAALINSSNNVNKQQQQLLAATSYKNESNKDNNIISIKSGSGSDGKELLSSLNLMQQQQQERRVGQLIECQLLVEKYEYFKELLEKELEPLEKDLELIFEGGLIFLSEYVFCEPDLALDQSSITSMESIQDLSNRCKEFNMILKNSFENLNLARQRLAKLNQFRSLVLSRLLIEFHQLMSLLSLRQYYSNEDNNNNTSIKSPTNTIRQMASSNRQLDAYQETSEWAKKLSLRFEYIKRQNELLAKEYKLLAKAKLEAREIYLKRVSLKTNDEEEEQDDYDDENMTKKEGDEEFLKSIESREIILNNWNELVQVISSFWCLIEEYETQQVKWSNLDTKRIEYKSIEEIFDSYRSRLHQLKLNLSRLIESDRESTATEIIKDDDGDEEIDIDRNQSIKLTFELNLDKLERRLDFFSQFRLPIFKFLTNKYLTDLHWQKLSSILETTISEYGNNLNRTMTSVSQQNCTTLAQFLELLNNGIVDDDEAGFIDKLIIEQLKIIDKQATLEHELTMFLFSEAGQEDGKLKRIPGESLQKTQLDISHWLENWSDEELIIAGSRFLETKLSSMNNYNGKRIIMEELASKLVSIHSLIKRFLNLKYNSIGLDLPDLVSYNSFILSTSKTGAKSAFKWPKKRLKPLIVLSTNNSASCAGITNSNLIRSSLFVEFLRIFTKNLIKKQHKLMNKIESVQLDLGTIDGHIEEINCLVERVKELHETDLKDAEEETEKMLICLEKQTIKLELDREILATKEAMALDKQREALRIRDDCIKQITERAIPAIRASTKALDCLNEKSLKTLRSIKPKPPEPVRLVIEAVCLLRSCRLQQINKSNKQQQEQEEQQEEQQQQQEQETNQRDLCRSSTCWPSNVRFPLEPERRFDSLRGIIVEDYWPVASKQLMGTHSNKFINDLRRLDKKSIPSELMHLIRKRYLSSDKFKLHLIQRVSLDAAYLAKWLIAVDVFDRVINVVKPNYKNYLDSERKLNELFQEVNRRHKEIDLISLDLLRMEDSFELKIKHKMSIVESLEQCKWKLKEIQSTREELFEKRDTCLRLLRKLFHKQEQLANRCLIEATKSVYIESMKFEDRRPMINLINELIFSPMESNESY